ncbi:uncharacterized protein LOC111055422 isoform X2 [Nilaparvata lugens]|uniref:uncharacterized protein LOC111055422 isoform X2 n=1 Tax=Nilaparvata lugens TaxID=108931 RepID=UPI00193CDC22|nr:uncharacterized protein LOC111055422 isoform X2 [Nilaparvata lugens]
MCELSWSTRETTTPCEGLSLSHRRHAPPILDTSRDMQEDVTQHGSFEYDPKMVDCFKKNLEHFDIFANDCAIKSESELYKSVVSLLESVDTHSTDEHKTGGVFGAEDGHYFLDLDMAVLGGDSEYYATEYATNIQAEYDFLPEPMYKGLRLKVLQSFLQIPNIFATKEFREKYEEQARANIQKEVEKLK